MYKKHTLEHILPGWVGLVQRDEVRVVRREHLRPVVVPGGDESQLAARERRDARVEQRAPVHGEVQRASRVVVRVERRDERAVEVVVVLRERGGV